MVNKLYLQNLNSRINENMVGQFFKRYTGNRFIRVKVSAPMVGHVFGEFIKTRKLHIFNKKN